MGPESTHNRRSAEDAWPNEPGPMLRIHTGLEGLDDLKADLAQGLERYRAAYQAFNDQLASIARKRNGPPTALTTPSEAMTPLGPGRAMARAMSRRHSLPWQGPVPKPV